MNNNELRDGLVVLQMMSVKGGMEYVKELAGRNNNARGNLQNAQDGRQAENRNPRRGQGNNREIDGRNGNGHQNSIRESRSDESGFSIARSMDELKAEVKEAFLGAKVQEQGNKLIFTVPNGQKVTFTPRQPLRTTRPPHGGWTRLHRKRRVHLLTKDRL